MLPKARRRGDRTPALAAGSRNTAAGQRGGAAMPESRPGPWTRERRARASSRAAGSPDRRRPPGSSTSRPGSTCRSGRRMERGDFDDLPGAGKPIADLGEPPRPGLVDQETSSSARRSRCSRRASHSARRTPRLRRPPRHRPSFARARSQSPRGFNKRIHRKPGTGNPVGPRSSPCRATWTPPWPRGPERRAERRRRARADAAKVAPAPARRRWWRRGVSSAGR